MTKTGRNELCPCGSGKKYKKCCLNKEEGENVFYRRAMQTSRSLMDKFGRFVVDELGEQALDEGIQDFFLGYEENQDKVKLLEEFGSLFWPWLFFSWTIDPVDLAFSELEQIIPPNTTLAELYLQTKGNNLDKWEQGIFSELNRKPFNFLEAKEISIDKGFQVEDLITGSEFFITDPELSNWVVQNDIIYANPCHLEGHNLLIAIGEAKVPEDWKSKIIEYRTGLLNGYSEITDELLWENMIYTRDIYLNICFMHFLDPQDEGIEEEEEEKAFRTIYYDIQSPENAFEALYPLCRDISREELLNNAEFDSEGKLHEVEIPWNNGEDDTEDTEGLIEDDLLGIINIEGRELTIEVLSRDREEEIKQEIEFRLSNEASYRRTVVESWDEYLEEEEDFDDLDPESDWE